jgi:hypothetical protein
VPDTPADELGLNSAMTSSSQITVTWKDPSMFPTRLECSFTSSPLVSSVFCSAAVELHSAVFLGVKIWADITQQNLQTDSFTVNDPTVKTTLVSSVEYFFFYQF